MNNFHRILIKFQFWYDMGFLTCLYFIKISFLCLIGKMGIITSDNPISKGGYSYLRIILSKFPVSSKHQYN